MTEHASIITDNVPNMPAITQFCGGSGGERVAMAIRDVAGPNLRSVVTVFDSGGSTQKIREAIQDLPAIGDLRRLLVGMMDAKKAEFWGPVLDERFNDVDEVYGEWLKGHNPGNILIAKAFQLYNNDLEKAIYHLCKDGFDIQGTIYPVTNQSRHLITDPLIGETIYGEAKLDEEGLPELKGAKISFSESTKIGKGALDAIIKAEMIVFAPGSLYASLLPILATEGTSEAINGTEVIQVANLVTDTQTLGLEDIKDQIEETNRIAGFPVVKTILVNTGIPTVEQIDHYAKQNQYPTKFDPDALYDIEGVKHVIPMDLLARDTGTSIRHDVKALHNGIIGNYYRIRSAA